MPAHSNSAVSTHHLMSDSTSRKRWNFAASLDALATLAAAVFVLALIADVAQSLLPLQAAFFRRAVTLAALAAAVVFASVVLRLGEQPFGSANRVTTMRAIGVAFLAGFSGEAPAPVVLWTIVVFAIVLLVLDGLDGRLARRSGLQSPFGARFDMETDAALTFVLALLCWQFGKAGVWILAVGLMRYAFVAASRPLPWIGRALPYSRRRQTICVLQLSGLLATLSPLFSPPASSIMGLLTLLMLSSSFAVDLNWLASRRPDGATPV